MVVVKFKAQEASHILHKTKKMQKALDEIITCLEEKMEDHDEEDYEEDYDEPSYRGNVSYRGGMYRSRYRMGR